MPAKDGRPTNAEARIVEARLKYEFRLKVLHSLRWIGYILASWLPLQPLRGMVESLAGEETTVSLINNWTMSISVTLCASTVVLVKWLYGQRKELRRGRERIKRLEERLGDREPSDAVT